MKQIKFRLRDRQNHIVGYETWYEGAWQIAEVKEEADADTPAWEEK